MRWEKGVCISLYYSESEGAVSRITKSDDDSFTATRRPERSRLLVVACAMSRSLVESQLVLAVVRPQLERKKRRPMVGNGDLLPMNPFLRLAQTGDTGIS